MKMDEFMADKTRIRWLSALLLVSATFISCNDAKVFTSSSGGGGEASYPSASTTEDAEEPAVEPAPSSGVNLVYSCVNPSLTETTAQISCNARTADYPTQKVTGVTWGCEMTTPVSSSQLVIVEDTPADPDRDVVYNLSAGDRTDLATLVSYLRITAEYQGVKHPVAFESVAKGTETEEVVAAPIITPDSRIMYQDSSVVAPGTCDSETQTATCTDGVCGAYTGTYTNQSCTISRTMYLEPTEGACKSEVQTSTCQDGACGAFSGTYTSSSCQACAGARVGGFCWYLSSTGQSCTSACSSHGGVTGGTVSYSGWPSGTLSHCDAVLAALEAGSGSAGDFSNPFFGSGCSVVGSRQRCTGKTTTQAATDVVAQRACSCAQ